MYQKLIEVTAQSGADLVAVSKTKAAKEIMAVYLQGQRIFGENRAMELADKYEGLPKDIHWHMIGHLQTNKVKYIAPFVQLIHSADSPRLLKEIDKQAINHERKIDVLLQFKIAEEDTKYGFDLVTASDFLESDSFQKLKNIRICGVMGMATFTDDEQQVRSEFKKLKAIFEQLKTSYFTNEPSFKEISMGMSGDYQIALEEGSTMVRIGSLIFGER